MSTILIAAYHPIVLKGISEVVTEKLPDSKIAATANDAKTFLALLEIHKPKVAVLDVAITWKSEIDILDEIYRIHPTVKLYFVSTHPFDNSVQKYLIKRARKRFKDNASEIQIPLQPPVAGNGVREKSAQE